jgi:hypothetical protein
LCEVEEPEKGEVNLMEPKGNLIQQFYGVDIYKGFPIESIPYKMHTWNYEINPLFEVMIERTRPKVIVEVGSWYGFSTFIMADACKKLELDTKIICIDTWEGGFDHLTDDRYRPLLLFDRGYPTFYFQFLANVIHRGHQDIIVPIANTSQIACRFLKYHGIEADLIYVDGSHEVDDVYMDLCYYSKITRNPEESVIFGDDYAMESVREGIGMFLEDEPEWDIVTTEDWYWILEYGGNL